MKFRNRWFGQTCVAAALVAVLVACPAGQTTPPPETGTLQVNLSGLPAGASGNVSVSGPDGFKQTVTQASSVLASLKSGLYSFTVNPVKPDAATFSDDSSPKSFNFVAGTGGSVTLKYACSAVKPPDANLDAELKAATGKQTYNCADLAKITSLIASTKGIVEIDGIQYATGLTSLDLIGNKISVLPVNVFNKLTQLTGLGLEFNQISVLPANVFDKLTRLAFLRLDNNQISVLPANVFDKLTQLTFLGLNTNCLAAQQEPLKTILSKVNGTVSTFGNPKAGCPQKTISIVSIETQKLTTAHESFAGETIYLKTRIDGVAQADGDPIFTTVKPGSPVSINQSLFVNSELRVELFTQDIAGDIKIGEATVTVNNQYLPGLEIVPLIENGAVYVLKLEKK
jgi:hypothetical protein